MQSDNPLHKSFMKSLKKRYTERRIWAEEESISSYRLFDNEHSVPLSIDIYNNKFLQIDIYSRTNFDANEYIELAGRALAIPKERIFYRDLLIKDAKDDTNEPYPIWVVESGLEFKVNLGHNIATGFALEQRTTRADLIFSADKQRVLNLFCNTGNFSLCVAKGNAELVKSVDINPTYLEWAKENMIHNHLEHSNLEWVNQDVLTFLDDEATTSNRYQIIILTPPISSNKANMKKKFDIEKDHTALINQCLKLLTAEGFIFFSTPLTSINLKKEYIDANIKDITEHTTPYDFRRRKSYKSFIISAKKEFKKPSKKR